MTLIIPAGFGQVIHQLRLAGDPEPMAVTYGIAVTATGVSDPAGMANTLHDAFWDALGAQLNGAYTLFSTEVKWRDEPLADLSIVVNVEPKVGTATGAALPQNVAGLVQKRTQSSGRRNRGRFYLPGLREGEVSDTGQISSGSLVGINGVLASWLAKFGATLTNVEDMVILHNLGVSPAAGPTIVTQLLLDPVVATQRRRLRK
jgi:hypothetical protein